MDLIRSPGLRTFLIIWTGQFVSLLGTGMTRFALLIWAYQQTGQATTVALLGFFSFVPFIVVSPVAGAVVDRVDRRRVMLLSDLGAGLMTAALLLLLWQDRLAIWHLFAAEFLAGVFESFQGPAYSAATTMLVKPADLSRVNGLRSLADAASQVLAPMLAGALLVWVGIEGVMLIDVATFLAAVVTLIFVSIPHPAGDEESPTHFWGDLSYGLHFIWQRPGLIALLLIFVGMNFFGTLTYFSLIPVMVLARTGGNELAWATVQMSLGLGGVAGGLIASVWRGPRPRIHAIYGGAALSFLLGDSLLALGRTVPVWSVAAFLAAIFIPLISANDRAIWQSKTPPAAQGRVFAANGMIRISTMPLAALIAGPLADRIFEPAMAEGGWLTPIFGPLVGTGPGTGVAVLFLGTCVAGTLMSLSGYLWRAARRVEEDLPDYAPAAVEAEPADEPVSTPV